MLKRNVNVRRSRILSVVILCSAALVVFLSVRPQQETTAFITASVKPSTIHRGEVAVLRWQSDNIKELFLTSGTDVRKLDSNGETLVSPIESTVFIFSGSDPSGRALRKEIVLSVLQPPLPPQVSLRVEPTVIGKGDSTTLKWETTGATVVNISGIGDVPMSGSKTVSPPPGRSTYTVTAVGAGGTTEKNIEVVVLPVSLHKGQIVEGYSTMSLLTFKDDENKDKERYSVTFQGAATIRAPFDGEVSVLFVSISANETFPGISVTFYDHNRVTLAEMIVYGDNLRVALGLEPYYVDGFTKNRTVQKGRVIATSTGNIVLYFIRLEWVNNTWMWLDDHNMLLYYFPTLFDGK